MSSLMEKMLKSGNIKSSSILSKSDFFNAKEVIPTELPILNIAFSGSLDGGLLPGLTVFAGVSKSFKTMLGLYCMKAYLNKYKDGIALLYDSEFGITPEYLASFEIDIDRVIHIPLENVEQLKFDIVQRLQEINKKDNVFILIDSIGNLASKKEVEDAENEKSVADMSRAKSLKSLFRIITPHLTTKNIPCIAINHVYAELGLYPKAIVSGGCVLEGTKIQTPGGFKAVELFQPGDFVITQMGSKEVTHVWNPETLVEGNPECYKITFEDGYTVDCSDTHEFLVDGEWLEAKDLIEGTNTQLIDGNEIKITAIEKIGRKPVYDLSIADVEHYVLQNGVVTHNTGIMYSSNQVFIIGKSQEKDGTDLAGFKFTINIEKSRYVKEKAKLPFKVYYDTGIQKWSSLFDIAIECGAIIKPKVGWYQTVDMETGEISDKSYRAKDLENNDAFFESLIKNETFKKYVEKKFKLSSSGLNGSIPESNKEEDVDIEEDL